VSAYSSLPIVNYPLTNILAYPKGRYQQLGEEDVRAAGDADDRRLRAGDLAVLPNVCFVAKSWFS
jgi:hypothetical protein